MCLFLYPEHSHYLKASLHGRSIHVVFKYTAVFADGEQSQFRVLVLVEALSKGDTCDFYFMSSSLSMELPLDWLGCITLEVIFLKEANALI
jgi:hypothetical protein